MYRISSRAEGACVEDGRPVMKRIPCSFHHFVWPVEGVVVPDDWFADPLYLRRLLGHPGILVEQSEDGETWTELDPRAVPGSPPAGDRPGSNYYDRYTKQAKPIEHKTVDIGATRTETESTPRKPGRVTKTEPVSIDATHSAEAPPAKTDDTAVEATTSKVLESETAPETRRGRKRRKHG